jgi:N-terminal domain of reverse transcriptase
VSQRLGAKTQGRALTVAWQDIPWKKVQRHVFRLQKRMYRATQRGDVRTAHKLQKLLVKSWYARLLAVRRISQDNRGKHTAGIDGVKSLTPTRRWRLATSLHLDGRATPLRRTWIPKRGSAEKRPLGIPMCPAYCISCASLLGIVLAEPAYLSQLHWAQTVSLITATSEWPHRFCLTADDFCVLPPHPGYYTTQGPCC